VVKNAFSGNSSSVLKGYGKNVETRGEKNLEKKNTKQSMSYDKQQIL